MSKAAMVVDSSSSMDELLVYQPKNEQEKAEKLRLLRMKVRTLREGNLLRSNLLEGKDPAYAYHWVHNAPERISHFRGLHYELVRGGPDGNDPVKSAGFEQPDGTHVRGDSVLMRVRKEIAELLIAENDLRAIEAVESAREEFFDYSQAQGVPAQRR